MTYLDASALVSLFLPDIHTQTIRHYLRTEHPLLGVSDFAVAEFASAVARRMRTGEFTPSRATHALNVSDSWLAGGAERLALDPADIPVATTFVRRFALCLRAADAMHLAICRRLGLSLFTFDRGQAAGAVALGIQLDPFGPPPA